MHIHHCECGCGEIIFEYTGHYKSYVDNVHRQRAYDARQREKRKKSKIVGIERKCMNCGDRFIARTDRHVFCCDSCRVSYWQQMKRLSAQGEE